MIAITMPVAAAAAPRPASVLPIEQGFVDAGGLLIYYEAVGKGEPLVMLHGGPGASHDYLLPYVLSLARTNRVVFIDERGSGKSEKLEDPKGYTVETMVEDVEAVRQALGLGKMNLLGHSFGGVLAQAYAFKSPQNLNPPTLGSTCHSTPQLTEVFLKMKAAMSPELRGKIDAMERKGLFDHGKGYDAGRYTNDYMIAAWGEGYFPYLYGRRPDANYDPVAAGVMSWDLYREMWGSHGEFVVDGNLASVEYADRLPGLARRADPDPGRRSRPGRPVDLERHASPDSGLEARRPSRERAYDLRGPARAVPPRGRRLRPSAGARRERRRRGSSTVA
jgi:proline iminopeptidase